MAYCPNCAAVLDPAQKFCSRCGQSSSVAPIAVAPAIPATSDASPTSVRLAIVILTISLAISIFSVANFFLKYHRAATSQYLVRSIGFDVLWILFMIGLWQRQSWARFGVLALTAWGLGSMAISMMRIASSLALFAFAVPILVAALHLFAAYLVFRPESNAWFRK
jgi:hypothetical protein